jgi:hypothetical protein
VLLLCGLALFSVYSDLIAAVSLVHFFRPLLLMVNHQQYFSKIALPKIFLYREGSGD